MCLKEIEHKLLRLSDNTGWKTEKSQKKGVNEIMSTAYLVYNNRMVDCSFVKVFEGDVLDDTATNIWSSKRLDSGSVLCVCHPDISGPPENVEIKFKSWRVNLPGEHIFNSVKYSRVLTQRSNWCFRNRELSSG